MNAMSENESKMSTASAPVATPAIGFTVQHQFSDRYGISLATHYAQDATASERAAVQDVILADLRRLKSIDRIAQIEADMKFGDTQAKIGDAQFERAEEDYQRAKLERAKMSEESANDDMRKQSGAGTGRERRGAYVQSAPEKQRQKTFVSAQIKADAEREDALRKFAETKRRHEESIAVLMAERDALQAVIDAPFISADH